MTLTLAGMVVLVLGACLAALRPTWIVPVVLFLAPLRAPVLDEAHLATLVLLGAAAMRSPAIVRVTAERPALLGALLLFPLWIVASALWAHQPFLILGVLVKWLVVLVALGVAAADPTRDARHVVVAAFAAMTPHALWAVAERLHLIAPLGDAWTLKMRAIDYAGNIRGRALFWHPNRLAEFVEQLGLLLVGSGILGVLPWLCAIGAAIALAGIWGTGSMGAIAAMGGGALLTIAWARAPRAARRVGLAIGAVAVVAALLVAVVAFRAHGGVGSRMTVYRYVLDHVIALHPWVGLGAGNWPLAVAAAPLAVSRFWFRSHAHSLPLHLWAELGIVGVILAGIFFAAPLAYAYRRLARAPASWRAVGYGAIAGVFGLLAHDMVHYFLRDPVDGITTGLLLGIAVGVGRRADEASQLVNGGPRPVDAPDQAPPASMGSGTALLHGARTLR